MVVCFLLLNGHSLKSDCVEFDDNMSYSIISIMYWPPTVVRFTFRAILEFHQQVMWIGFLPISKILDRQWWIWKFDINNRDFYYTSLGNSSRYIRSPLYLIVIVHHHEQGSDDHHPSSLCLQYSFGRWFYKYWSKGNLYKPAATCQRHERWAPDWRQWSS